MIGKIRHRGPDGEGVASHRDATIGMTRLAIVDVAHGHQPMANDDGSVVIVFNGEIYNAPVLRRELQREGVRFRTRSDTEVILRWYEREPERVEERLAGMWAFAIHDRRRRRLVLSRDRFGIKPLFIADAGTAVAFASELRCFETSLHPFSRLFEIDHDAAHAMVSWSYVPENHTIYRGVQRLPPATRLTIDLAAGARQWRTYWQLTPSREAARVRSFGEASDLVAGVLRRAVREHLESDVPIATFLSGGIDSSLVTAFAHEASPDIRSYSIGFHEPELDESPHARAVASALGVGLHVNTFDERQARASLADALLAYDEPFGDSSSLATYLLSRRVGSEYKVALAGDGGDEVFAGYRKHLVTRMRRPLAGTPRLRRAVSLAIGCGLRGVPLRNDHRQGWREALRRCRRMAAALGGSDAEAYVQLTQFAPLARTAALMRRPGSASRFEEETCQRFDRAHGTELQKSIAADLTGMTCNDMLVKVDRAAMAHHLEVRVPFLDHRVVECGVGLPEAYTIGSGPDGIRGKRILRALHAQRFGALAYRKKHGFGVPVKKWLAGPFDGVCERLFERHRLDRFGILSSAALSDGRFREWVDTDPSIVWHAFALAAWCEAVMGDGPEALRALVGDGLSVGATV
jgi:asparagine synthase (glutamine-hydrolysing)